VGKDRQDDFKLQIMTRRRKGTRKKKQGQVVENKGDEKHQVQCPAHVSAENFGDMGGPRSGFTHLAAKKQSKQLYQKGKKSVVSRRL